MSIAKRRPPTPAQQEFKRAARVYLIEASNRRHSASDRNFYWVLLGWAAKSRRQAARCSAPNVQGELFA